MRVERGTMGSLPWAATGTGPPVVVLSGLSPRTGVGSDALVRAVLAPVRHLAGSRRLFALNRRPGLPADLTMAGLAAEHADALRSFFGTPVDVLGISTGGSIAQQLAAEHPDVVRRLVLISTGCRLGEVAREEQAAVAARLRAGETRQAAALLALGVAPWAGSVARMAGRAAAGPLLGGRRSRADLLATLEAEDPFDLARCAGTIQAPTLIVGGARDLYYDAALLRETAALIPGARLLIVPRRGHVTVIRDRRTRAHVSGFLGAGPG